MLFKKPPIVKPASTVTVLGLMTLIAASGCASSSRVFSTPSEASAGLVDAMRKQSESDLKSIFGPEADDVIYSGDPVQDRNSRRHFLTLYDEKNELVAADDGTETICIGANEWPFPIPVVKAEKGRGWVFDTARGKEEIINRRVGRNERSAIQVCLAICDAQFDYVRRFSTPQGIPVYAGKFVSDSDKHNGLYWEAKPGESQSPLGALVAHAQGQGYAPPEPGSTKMDTPYHGYYYRLLTTQGSHAPGGEYDYTIDGRLIGGFAVVAYPADYGHSGVMTFIVNHQGIVYQRNLGEDTGKIASDMKQFDPSPEWTKADTD